MLRFVVRSVASFALLLTLMAVSGTAQDQKKLAITDIAAVDSDFAYQGEYSGAIRSQNCGCRYQRVGLHAVAHGDGKFIGAVYPNGLPGGGWHGDKTKVAGSRNGDVLEMEGGHYLLSISKNVATVRSDEGAELGRLYKVNRRSQTLGARSPYYSTVLFNGTDTSHFKNGKMTDDGLLKEGTEFIDTYQDFTLHLEFRLPYMPYARGQGRSNSGVYLQSRYEVQILDSFGLDGIENECAALYRYKKPDVNMCFPPLSWQSYDITFTSPRFDSAGEKTRNARLTVRHNGVAVHNNFEVERKTGAGKQESPELFPIKLQNHSNPIRFRNIWIVENNRLCRPCGRYASTNQLSNGIAKNNPFRVLLSNR